MGNGELISCIIPVYNGERFVHEAIDSVTAQRYRPIEIITVDDGSTDATADVLRSYGPVVRVLHQANGGPAAARNAGLAAARGPFIAFHDADDLWHPEKLMRQMARLDARPEVELCLTHLENVAMPGVSAAAALQHGHVLNTPLAGYVMATVLARRSVFDRVGVLNAAMRSGEDTEWFTRAREHGAVVDVLPEVLYCRRVRPDTLSWRTAAVRDDGILDIVKRHLDRERARTEHGRR